MFLISAALKSFLELYQLKFSSHLFIPIPSVIVSNQMRYSIFILWLPPLCQTLLLLCDKPEKGETNNKADYT